MSKQGYITLAEIIQSALFQNGETGTHKYFKYKSFAVDAFKMFHMDLIREVKTVKLTMSPVKTVEFPEDYVDWVKIGLQIGDRVKVYIPDPSLALLQDSTACGVPIVNPVAYQDGITSYPFNTQSYWFNYYDNGSQMQGFYGYGDGRIENGFRINGTTIQFNSDVENNVVYMEYVSDGFNPSEQSLVPVTCEFAIKSYIKWQVKEHARDSTDMDKERGKRDFANQFSKAKARISPLTIEGILHASREHYGASIKA